MEKLIQYATKASFYEGPFGTDGVPWIAAGMGYVIVTQTGGLIVIDGGHGEDAERLIELLEEYSGGEPEVDLWVLTHPHKDHYGALYAIASSESLASRVTVKRIVYRFPPEFREEDGSGIEYVFPHMEQILSATGAERITPMEGMTLDSCGMKLHFLYAPEDTSWLDDKNQLSLIFTVHGRGRKILFNGDADIRNLKYVLSRHAHDVCCDIIQLPHHGLCDTGLLEYYTAADARYAVLVPISVAGDREMGKCTDNTEYMARLFAEGKADTVYKAYEGTSEIAL